MIIEINYIKKFLEKLSQDRIIFDPHFYKRSQERPINEGLVRSYLSKIDKLEKIERGKSENRFKLWYKLSSKYSLILIIETDFSKDLKVISAWNNNRKWQKKLKQ